MSLVVESTRDNNQKNTTRADNPELEEKLKKGFADMKIESLLRATVRRFRSNMSVNIDYANEYLTRTRHSQLGLLTFFIVDDLFEALNLDATRAVFGAESGYKLNDIHDAETIKELFMLAENVKLLDTVAEKTIAWYRPRAKALQKTEDFVWDVWSDMQAAEYIRKIKQIFEGFPGRETIPLGLPIKRHKFDPNKTGSVIVVQDRMVRKSNLSNNRSRSRQRLRADQDGKRNKSSSSMVVSESCSKGRCHHCPRQSVSTSTRINPQSMDPSSFYTPQIRSTPSRAFVPRPQFIPLTVVKD